MNSRVQTGRSTATTRSAAGEPDLRPGKTAKSGSGESADIISDVKDAARSAGQTLKHQASDLGAEVGHELKKTASAQKEKGAEALRSFAGAMNAAADELSDQSPAAADRVRDTASKIEALSENIAEKDVGELLNSAAKLAREQPAWFLGGAIAVGFGVTRFLMANPPRQTGAKSRNASRGSKSYGS